MLVFFHLQNREAVLGEMVEDGLVLARALRDNKAFGRTLQRLKKRLLDVR